MPRRHAVGALALAVALVACSPPPDPDASARPLDCNPIGDTVPAEGYVTVLATLALPDPDGPPLQAVEDPQATGVERWFSKAGLGVNGGGAWSLRVAEGSAEHLRIGWGSPGAPGTTVLPATCKVATSSLTGWLWWPGGLWTDEPGCYGVVVEVDGHSEVVDVPVGASCG